MFSWSLSPSSTAIRRDRTSTSASDGGTGRSADASTPRVSRKPMVSETTHLSASYAGTPAGMSSAASRPATP
ncbi:hypothetical protein ACFQX8_16825 [Klenkia terrae]|uniref:hypothetical protein n=1 Tax=Klenkia terrae TaxID=1052259 RepID=UPI00360D40F4